MNDASISIPLLALYAETHFTFFKFQPSLLFKKEPEILFDAPRRVEAPHDIPIMLLINDSNVYPISILRVEISLSQKGTQSSLCFCADDLTPYRMNHPFQESCAVFVFPIPRHLCSLGLVHFNAKLSFVCRGKKKDVINDNLFGSSHSPLLSLVTNKTLPGKDTCSYGDLHVHTQYSRSHVEFGPPIALIDQCAFVSGHSFFAVTDHSYDCTCKKNNFLAYDTNHENWYELVDEVYNKPHKTIVISGEEVSCYNSKGSLIHAGVLGIKRFIPGDADGARFSRHSQTLKLPEVTQMASDDGGMVFAAHPITKYGILQTLILKRDYWSKDDFTKDIVLFQGANNGFNLSWVKSKKLWIELLLERKKITLIAGNDSHGDFNRYRAIKTPFLSIYENSQRYFCYLRTGIYNPNPVDYHDVLQALAEGKTFVTSGPYLSIIAKNDTEQIVIGATISSRHLFVCVESSEEWGSITSVRVIWGCYREKSELTLLSLDFTDNNLFSLQEHITIDETKTSGYIRAECHCSLLDQSTKAYTSPVYFSD